MNSVAGDLAMRNSSSGPGVCRVFADERWQRLQDPGLLAELVDRHGTGRVIFRNTRDG